MSYFRISLWFFILLAGSAAPLRAEDAPPKTFIPLVDAHHMGANSLAAPHFFPLKAKPITRILVRPAAAEAPEAEIPVLKEQSTPDPMTPEQAKQILSIFGEAE